MKKITVDEVDGMFLASDGEFSAIDKNPVKALEKLYRKNGTEAYINFEDEDEDGSTSREEPKVVEEKPKPPVNLPRNRAKPAPLENKKSSNFDIFEGTSWEGKKQPH